MRPFLFFSLIILALALPLGGFYLGRSDELANRLREIEGELKKSKAEVVRLKAENTRLENRRMNASVPIQRVMPAQAPQMTESEPDRRPYRMSRSDELYLDRNYGSLFHMLGLNEEELAYFKQLLNDRKVSRMDIYTDVGNPALTTKDILAKVKAVAGLNQTYDEAVRHFLNHEDDYVAFKHWEDTRAERQQIELARSIFQSENALLTPSQEEELLKLIVSVRSEKLTERPIEGMEGRELKHSHRTQMRKEAEKRRIQELAPRFLNPAQVAALKKSGIGMAP